MGDRRATGQRSSARCSLDAGWLRQVDRPGGSSARAAGTPTTIQRDQDGDLQRLIRTPALTGVPVSREDAVARAAAFLEQEISWFDEADMRLIENSDAEHVAGESLLALEWRLERDGVLGPKAVSVEFDRRSGKPSVVATYEPTASTTEWQPTVSRADAISEATRLAGPNAAVAKVVPSVGARPVWSVYLDAGISPVGVVDRSIVVVDAETGKILDSASTS